MIKATFKNIGPIKDAKLELGELTVIAGQNNTGKTYLVYTLYGFLNFFKEQMFPHVEYLNHKEFSNQVKKIARQIVDTGQSRVELELYKKINDQMAQKASTLFSSELLNHVFSSPNGEFKDANFYLETEYENKEEVKTPILRRNRKEIIIMNSSFEDGAVVFRISSQEDVKISLSGVEYGLVVLFWRMMRKNLPEPFILSAERFGISLFYKELDFTKNRLVEELQKLSTEKQFDPFGFLEKESARYAQPIKDNIDFTRDLARIQKQKSDFPIDKDRSVKKIMDGYYRVKNDEIRFISNRRGENRFDIPLHLASSSARGVSDLYFYLKHIAQPGQILIIDEPESHLSPTNQVLMARLLVFCVNAGLKVLITTHSDYLIKEINNLIMLSSNFEGKRKFLRKNKNDYTEDDYLKPDLVRAYTCEDGKLQPCSVDEKGIDMPVFDDAIDRVNEVANDLSLLHFNALDDILK